MAAAYRPFVSTDAAVAEPGDVEIELGYIGFRQSHGRNTIVAPTVIGNLGLVRDLELVAETKATHQLDGARGDRSQAEDTAVSIKWLVREGALQDQGSGPSLAMEFSLLVPTAVDEKQPGGEVIGVASGTGFGWTYHINGGATVDTVDGEPGVVWGIILEHPLRGHLRVAAEVNGEALRGSAASNSALVGAIWEMEVEPPLHGLSFDVGLRHGISRSADEWGGTAGFTVAFPW